MARFSLALLTLCISFLMAVSAYAGTCSGITCPANIAVSNDANQCGAVVNYPAPTSSGTCGTITCSPASGSFFDVPASPWTVSCSGSLGGSCSFTITVQDTQDPTITCPGDIVQQEPGPAVVNFSSPTASDNCPFPLNAVTCDPASGSTFPLGETTDTCTATDASANETQCTFSVTLPVADLSITKNDSPDPVLPGENLTYTIVVTNNGPSDANLVSVEDTLPPNTTLALFISPAGWSTSTPAVGGSGTITATKPTMTNGETAVFTLVVTVDAGVPDGTVISNTATITAESPGDDKLENNTSTTTTSVGLPQITIDDVTVTEGDSGTVDACFTLSLSKPSTDIVTVDAATADGTATSPDDYLSDAGTISIPAGSTSEPVCVTVNADLLDESDENFVVNLSNSTNATIGDDQGTGTILDDDGPPTPGPTNDDIEGSGCLLIPGANGIPAFPVLSLFFAVGILAVRRKKF